MKRACLICAFTCAFLISVVSPVFSAPVVEPYVVPVDAYITPYTSYLYSPGSIAIKTAYWGGGTGLYSGHIDACITHSQSVEDVYVGIYRNGRWYWYDDTYYFSSTRSTSQSFGIARFDSTSPNTQHKQLLYVASGGASGRAYSVVIEQ